MGRARLVGGAEKKGPHRRGGAIEIDPHSAAAPGAVAALAARQDERYDDNFGCDVHSTFVSSVVFGAVLTRDRNSSFRTPSAA